MLLSSLDDGITLLDMEGSRGIPILQSLILDHLLLHNGPAFWVDANRHVTTTTLTQIAPSQRLPDRIHVARDFTAYQHYGAVCDLPTAVNQSIQESTTDLKTLATEITECVKIRLEHEAHCDWVAYVPPNIFLESDRRVVVELVPESWVSVISSSPGTNSVARVAVTTGIFCYCDGS
jgi:hypothetical protein